MWILGNEPGFFFSRSATFPVLLFSLKGSDEESDLIVRPVRNHWGHLVRGLTWPHFRRFLIGYRGQEKRRAAEKPAVVPRKRCWWFG